MSTARETVGTHPLDIHFSPLFFHLGLGSSSLPRGTVVSQTGVDVVVRHDIFGVKQFPQAVEVVDREPGSRRETRPRTRKHGTTQRETDVQVRTNVLLRYTSMQALTLELPGIRYYHTSARLIT